MSGAKQNPKSSPYGSGRNRARKRRRASENQGSLQWRMQHPPLDDGLPALSRTQIIDAAGEAPPAYPMRAADTIEALERKGRIDHRAAAGAHKFEVIFQQASLHGLAHRDIAMLPGNRNSGGGEPYNVLLARDGVWQAIGALGGIGTPGANIVWDVLGLGMTIKAHAERCQFGNGRSLNPMTATGILVQACFTLAVHYGK